ncbi:MAG: hypothetical protein WDO17_07395 [Alphaproteobacteria bacterium]
MLDIDPLETLVVGSIEGFLTQDERTMLSTLMDQNLSAEIRHRSDAARITSLHEIPGASVDYARRIYEPEGRVELTELPSQAASILETASARSMPLVQSYAPSVRYARPWTYVEYGAGQFISSHMDRVAPSPSSRPLQVLGISVLLNEDITGGEFFVETTSNPELWSQESLGRLRFARTATDVSSDWFNQIPRTRWTACQRAGDALIYGTHVVHGTLPVRTGRARKFITWFACS